MKNIGKRSFFLQALLNHGKEIISHEYALNIIQVKRAPRNLTVIIVESTLIAMRHERLIDGNLKTGTHSKNRSIILTSTELAAYS